jgi:putative transposase
MSDMKKSKYSEEQIIGYLKQVEAGVPLKDMCRKDRRLGSHVL